MISGTPSNRAVPEAGGDPSVPGPGRMCGDTRYPHSLYACMSCSPRFRLPSRRRQDHHRCDRDHSRDAD
jgi:hypothetical protein